MWMCYHLLDVVGVFERFPEWLEVEQITWPPCSPPLSLHVSPQSRRWVFSLWREQNGNVFTSPTTREKNATWTLCCWLAAVRRYQLPRAMCFMTPRWLFVRTQVGLITWTWGHMKTEITETACECQRGSPERNLVAAVSSAETDNSSATHKVNTFLSEDSDNHQNIS